MEAFRKHQLEKGYTQKTINTNINAVKNFKLWCTTESIEFQKAGYNELMGYVGYCTNRNNKIATIQIKIKALAHYFEFLGKTDNKAPLIKLQGRIRHIPHNLFDADELTEIYKMQHAKGLAGKRDQVLLSLVVFQAVGSTELERIELKDVDLEQGTIYIPGTRNSNSRKLDLKPQQLFLLQNYMLITRKAILKDTQRESDKLLISCRATTEATLHNVIARILQQLKVRYPKIKSMQQIRQSVVTIWIKEHGLRKAQYMAGHKNVSSTERYNVAKMDSLKEEINKYFPM